MGRTKQEKIEGAKKKFKKILKDLSVVAGEAALDVATEVIGKLKKDMSEKKKKEKKT